jgi:hypothetical protein
MYIKYKCAGTATSSVGSQEFYLDIAGVMNGTITTPSQFNSTYCDTTDSVISGTLPTAGIYTVSVLSPTGTGISFYKKHYAYSATMAPAAAKIALTTLAAAGISMSVKNKASGNQLNTANQLVTAGGSGINIGNTWTLWQEFHLSITDTCIMFAGMGSRGATLQNTITYMQVWSDMPYIADYDDSAWAVNNNYMPSVYFACGGRTATFGTSIGGSTNHDLVVRRFDYRTHTGAFGTTTDQSSVGELSTHYGYISAITSYNTTPVLQPTPRKIQSVVSTVNGQGSLLTPVHYSSSLWGSSNTAGATLDTREGQMLGIYRVADNFGTPAHGDRIQVGSDYYRVMLGHKTGSAAMAGSVNTACYAFPESGTV